MVLLIICTNFNSIGKMDIYIYIFDIKNVEGLTFFYQDKGFTVKKKNQECNFFFYRNRKITVY